MMDSASVIEVTGSADSAYYSHQSFESDLSCDMSEANTERPEAPQVEQGEEFTKILITLTQDSFRRKKKYWTSKFL